MTGTGSVIRVPRPAPTIDELVVGDEPERWRAGGFTVDDDGVARIGAVRVRLDATLVEQGRRGIRGWSLRDAGVHGPTDVDGIATDPSDRPPAEPAAHPNGATEIDHLVVTSGDGDRTETALENIGLERRRLRDADNYPAPMQQRFFRLGPVILELVAPADPDSAARRRPARLYGLALTSADLDATVAFYDGVCNRAKDAVQPGRRIATLRTKELDLSVAIAFMTPEPSRASTPLRPQARALGPRAKT